MRSFLQYILEDKKEMPTIAFVAGAFRPPTAGHLHLVKTYSDMPKVNKVVIIISNPQDKKLLLHYLAIFEQIHHVLLAQPLNKVYHQKANDEEYPELN